MGAQQSSHDTIFPGGSLVSTTLRVSSRMPKNGAQGKGAEERRGSVKTIQSVPVTSCFQGCNKPPIGASAQPCLPC